MATSAQIEAYKTAKRHDWPLWSTDVELARRAEAWAYAGPDVMARHEFAKASQLGGLEGGAQVIMDLVSPLRAKARAGFWLREARYLRRLGYVRDARRALRKASRAIRFAQAPSVIFAHE